MQENRIIGRIYALCEIRGWSMYRLAKESGITYSTLCTMVHKDNLPSISTLIRICEGLGISLAEFFDEGNERALLSDEESRLLSLWGALSCDNRKQSIRYMELLLRDQLHCEQ